MINKNDAATAAVGAAVIATAGYVGAWFAAGPRSALSDPRAGAIMALAGAVTFVTAGRRVYDWALRHTEDKTQAILASVLISSVGAIFAARLCGYPVDLRDIDVLAIGLIVGIPVALAGLAIAIPLTQRFIRLIS